jgi:GT2 family glycosyltransferase
MCLIAMAVYATPENKKDDYFRRTILSLKQTVDFSKHRLILSVNAATSETMRTIETYKEIISAVIANDENIGTAEAINRAWATRLPGENAIKMDDDVIIHHRDWIYLMEESIRRDPTIGQVGLKRRDCIEAPWNYDDFYTSTLRMLHHEPGEKWITVEEVEHVMGTCVMHSSALLDKVGYLYQPGLYGFDDSLMSLRSKLAGFKNVFLTAVDIEHIDPGTTPFQKWKEQSAGKDWEAYITASREFSGTGPITRPLYYNPFKK